MNRRRIVRQGAPLLLFLLGVTAAFFAFRHPLTGWVKGESKYQGRYTNYWKDQVRSARFVRVGLTNGRDGDGPVMLHNDARSCFEEVRERGLLAACPDSYSEPFDSPLFLGDPRALPVLLELLGDPDPRVRRVAAWGLRNIGEKAGAAETASAIPALKTAAQDDDDERVRQAAEFALLACRPKDPLGEELSEEQLKWLKANAPDEMTEQDRARLRALEVRQ